MKWEPAIKHYVYVVYKDKYINTIAHLEFVLHKITIALKFMSYINWTFLEEVLLWNATRNVHKEWGRVELMAETFQGWMYFSFFYLLCSYYVIATFLIYFYYIQIFFPDFSMRISYY